MSSLKDEIAEMISDNCGEDRFGGLAGTDEAATEIIAKLESVMLEEVIGEDETGNANFRYDVWMKHRNNVRATQHQLLKKILQGEE